MPKYLITEEQAKLLDELAAIDRLINYSDKLKRKFGDYSKKH